MGRGVMPGLTYPIYRAIKQKCLSVCLYVMFGGGGVG